MLCFASETAPGKSHRGRQNPKPPLLLSLVTNRSEGTGHANASHTRGGRKSSVRQYTYEEAIGEISESLSCGDPAGGESCVLLLLDA